MDADGGSEALIPLPGNIAMPEPSPHGQRLAYSSNTADGGNSLWVAHINGKGARRITDVPPARAISAAAASPPIPAPAMPTVMRGVIPSPYFGRFWHREARAPSDQMTRSAPTLPPPFAHL